MTKDSHIKWKELAHTLGKDFAARNAAHDSDDTFVAENYDILKEHGFFSAAVPEELGGAGVPHSVMCDILRILGQYCGSTALALSMHQHLLAATIWKYKQGQGGEEMLKKVAAQQPVLVSTGAQDWLESSGQAEKTKNGFLVTAVKHFASQSAAGNILVTSVPYEDQEQGWQVLHFSIPFTADGIQVLNNWQALGMRGTGSHSVRLKRVFVPETSITLRRPLGTFHPVWNVILTVAMPLIMGAYVGIAQQAAQTAVRFAQEQKKPKRYLPSLVGALQNDLVAAELHWNDMVRICNDFDFKAIDTNGNDILVRKTNTTNACIGVVTKAMEIIGGQGFYRSFGMERLFRDIQAARYHPLQEKDQIQFTGEFILRNRDTATIHSSLAPQNQ